MFDIFDNIFSRHSSLEDRFFGMMMALLTVATAGGIILAGLLLVDSTAVTPTKETFVSIDKKQVIPAYTGVLATGKVVMPQYSPASYRILFRIEGREFFSSVEENTFNRMRVGDKVEVHYGYGHLLSSPQLISVRVVK
jgi:hypothetical protein